MYHNKDSLHNFVNEDWRLRIISMPCYLKNKTAIIAINKNILESYEIGKSYNLKMKCNK